MKEGRHLAPVHIYFDGGARGNPGAAGCAYILKSAAGHTIEQKAAFLGRRTNNHAEYMGLILALERALKLGFRKAHVHGDSELVLRQLLGEYRVRSKPLKPLYEHAKRLLGRFEEVQVLHIPRLDNRQADRLLNQILDAHSQKRPQAESSG